MTIKKFDYSKRTCDTAPLIRLEAENAAIMSIITKINRLDHKEAITDLFKIVKANESIMNDLRRKQKVNS